MTLVSGLPQVRVWRFVETKLIDEVAAVPRLLKEAKAVVDISVVNVPNPGVVEFLSA